MNIKKLLLSVMRRSANIVRRSPWATKMVRGILTRIPVLRGKIANVVHAPDPIRSDVSQQKINVKMIKSADISDLTEKGATVYKHIANSINIRKS